MRRAVPFFALAVLAGCGGSNTGTSPYSPDYRGSAERDAAVKEASKNLSSGPAAKVAIAANDFGFRLFKSIVGTEKIDKNVFIAPTSVSLALSMAYNGAAGETQKAMASTLGFGKLKVDEVNQGNRDLATVLHGNDPGTLLTIANSLWIKQGETVVPEFLKRVTDNYGAKAEYLDFGNSEAKDAINAWVKEATQGKIPTIIETTKPEDFMHLVNAVYFKGDWKDPFLPKATIKMPFENGDTTPPEVSMMSREGSYLYLDGDKFQAVSIPYGRGRVAMDVFLPKKGTSLAQFLSGASPKWLADQAKKMVLTPLTTLKIPKFRAENSFDLVPILKQMGMAVAFTDKADFTGMRKQGELLITGVTHKTYVDVDEQGTEAAGATDVAVGTTSMPVGADFIANRPFYYQIRDTETGTLVFVGVLVRP